MHATLREIVGPLILAFGALTALLLGGQLIHVGDLLLAPGALALWPRAMALGAVALLEVLLPLVGLLGMGLAFGRMRADGSLTARAALGGSPSELLLPVTLVGSLLGAAAAWVSQSHIPHAVAALRTTVLEGANRGILAGTRPLPGGGTLIAAGHGRHGGQEIWAVLPTGPRGPPRIIRAQSTRLQLDAQQLVVVLDDAWVWGPKLRAHIGQARIRFDDPRLRRRLGMLGSPNDTRSSSLSTVLPHHRFVWHRRWALPATAPLWAALGALIGGAVGNTIATVLSAGLVVAFYWLLRMGELACRAGSWSPAWAAWLPWCMLLVLLAVAARPLLARATPS